MTWDTRERGVRARARPASIRGGEPAGGPERLPSRILSRPKQLDQVGRVGRVALEIAVHEARLLSMEVAELEAHWRREEELARIMYES